MDKIINDPVYGFIRVSHPLIWKIIEHPFFQRLRRIKQMGLAHLVYPGAVHTRFHHSLGAYHLMGSAIDELRRKGVAISEEEGIAAQAAILMHDIGHGPFSHSLESTIIENAHHEEMSVWMMQEVNRETGGALDMTIAIFRDTYPKRFLHQLLSSQMDMDRMDYLNRDSFFTGVSEGVIGYDRILKMLAIKDDELVIEEKGVHSVEKFIVARRLMYWQVYLHKTVLSAEQMLIRILQRIKHLTRQGEELFAPPALRFFIGNPVTREALYHDSEVLKQFNLLDDSDIYTCLKIWAQHSDEVLAYLCDSLLNRHLLKVRFSSEPLDAEVEEIKKQLGTQYSAEMLSYLVFSDSTSNSTYNPADEKIKILLKNGNVKDISEVQNALINPGLAIPVKKFYICFPKL